MNCCAMETVKKMLKGIWEFCRCVFVPQRGKNMKVEYGDESFINQGKATE